MSLEFGDEVIFKRENLGMANLKAEQWEQGCRKVRQILTKTPTAQIDSINTCSIDVQRPAMRPNLACLHAEWGEVDSRRS